MRINPLTDMVGYGTYYAPIGIWSETTSLLLSTMDSIIENDNVDYDDIVLKMINWCNYSNYQNCSRVFNLSKANEKAIEI